jgi:transposase-like protein
MQTSVLDAKHFHDEEAAYAYLEARLWPNGPVCPHCGGFDRIGKMGGKSTRIGVYKCYQCRKPFRVTVGTVFEASHVPLRLWLQCVHLMASSKKGISSNQLSRTLGVTLRTAWFMSHRVREAMAVLGVEPLGGAGKVVEADETFFVNKKGFEKKSGVGHKMVVVSLLERGGPVRSTVIDSVSRPDVEHIIRQNVHRESRLMTDTAGYYRRGALGTDSHEMVDHSIGEYGRGDVHVNSLEGYFSVFKRGMKGVYQHCSERHLHRYVAEFDFRYSNRIRLGVNDVERADRTLKGIVGKRLTYNPPHH